MAKEQEQIQKGVVFINDGDSFFAHELTVNFTPTQFVLDFKNITPRTDPRTKDSASFLLKHNVIMVEPWHAKRIAEVLGAVVKRYEQEFGEVTKPKALEKAEKKQKSILASQKTTKAETPSYFG